mgnify:FL=1
MSNIKSFIENKNDFFIIDSARKLSKRLDLEIYIVGGYVRDLFTQTTKESDLDFMVVGDGIKFAQEFKDSLGGSKLVSFSKFGTARFMINNKTIEVASSRIEDYKLNSRNPKIDRTDLSTDILRRDFTINTLAVSVNDNDFGNLFDLFNGIKDINDGLIKTPLDPDKTFSDDPLRILRAIRFASQLGFEIDKKTKLSIQSKVERLSIVSSERIIFEFFKILDSPKPSIGLELLQKLSVMKIILPEISSLYGMEQTPEWHHKDVFYHTLKVVDNISMKTNKTKLRFAALLHDIGKPKTRRLDKNKGWTFHGHDAVGANMINFLSKRLKLSKEMTEYLKKLTLLHLRPISLAKKGVSDSAVRRLMVAAGEDIEDLMILCRADITSKNPNLVKKYLQNFDKVELIMNNVKEKDSFKNFQSPIRGIQIMKECKIKEGKIVGLIKKDIENAILDGVIENNYKSSYDYFLKIKEKYIK